MADVKTKYGASGQALTITLTSKVAASATQSTVVDNNTNLFMDALLTIKSKTAAGTAAGTKAIYVYAYGSVDGTTYPDSVTGTDNTITLNVPTQLKIIGVLQVPVSATAYQAGPFSVASAFGGVLPQKWGVVVVNDTGLALSGTAGDHVVQYQGILGQTV